MNVTGPINLLMLCLAVAPLGVLTLHACKVIKTFKRELTASGLIMVVAVIATNYLFISELFK